jgi:hypothetical protein
MIDQEFKKLVLIELAVVTNHSDLKILRFRFCFKILMGKHLIKEQKLLVFGVRVGGTCSFKDSHGIVENLLSIFDLSALNEVSHCFIWINRKELGHVSFQG